MGNKLFIQPEDPSAYPIYDRKYREVDQSSGATLHVMSYNLLADRLALPKYFPHTTPALLSFQFRGPRIITEFRLSDCDILCLQEVDRVSDYYDGMLNALGYKLIHYGRPGLLRGEGVAIAYKTDKFRVLETDQVNMDDLSKVYPGGGTFRKANQALLCLFQDKESGVKFVAGSAHLHFNPKYDFVKYAQALYLKERAAIFMQTHGVDLPLVIGGDFNSEPVSSVMSLLHSEDIEEVYNVKVPSQWEIPEETSPGEREYYKLTAKLFRDKALLGQLDPLYQNIQSAYNKYNKTEDVTRSAMQPKFTNYTVSFKGALDHILTNHKFSVVELLELPADETFTQDEGCCPNRMFPSDHLRIEAKLKFL